MPSHTISRNSPAAAAEISHELTGPGTDIVMLRLNVRKSNQLPSSVPNAPEAPVHKKTGFERKRDVVEPIVKERNGLSVKHLLDDLLAADYELGDAHRKTVMKGDVVQGHQLTLGFYRPGAKAAEFGMKPNEAIVAEIKSMLLDYAFRDGYVYPNPGTTITINLVARRTDFDVETVPHLRVTDNRLRLVV